MGFNCLSYVLSMVGLSSKEKRFWIEESLPLQAILYMKKLEEVYT